MYWNTFLAVSSDTASKSSAESGLSSAHSSNNSWGKRAGCAAARRERCSRAGEGSAVSPCLRLQSDLTSPCWVFTPAPILRPVPEGLLWCQSLGDREEAGTDTGGAKVWLTAAGPSPGPESSTCLQATAPAESSLIYTQIIYSAFLTHAFILLYCNVST